MDHSVTQEDKPQMQKPAERDEQHRRCKVVFDRLGIPSRYWMLPAGKEDEPYAELRSKVRQEFKTHDLSRRYFILLWIDSDGDEILVDDEESLQAAMNCVPIDGSGFRILRLYARHSSTTPTFPESQIPNGKVVKNVTNGNKNGAMPEIEVNPPTSEADSRDNNVENGGYPRNINHPASSTARASAEHSPEINVQKASPYAYDGLTCAKCGRTFGRKSSCTVHEHYCNGKLNTNQQITGSSKRKRTSGQVRSPSSRAVRPTEVSRSKQIKSEAKSSVDSFGPCGNCGRLFHGRPQWTIHQKKCQISVNGEDGYPKFNLNGHESSPASDGEEEDMQDIETAAEPTSKKKRARFTDPTVCTPGCGKKLSKESGLTRHRKICDTYKAYMASLADQGQEEVEEELHQDPASPQPESKKPKKPLAIDHSTVCSPGCGTKLSDKFGLKRHQNTCPIYKIYLAEDQQEEEELHQYLEPKKHKKPSVGGRC